MSIQALMNQPLVVTNVGAASKDAYGDDLPTAGTATNVLGYLEQESSVEHLDDRDTVVSRWIAYLPAGTQIGKLDRVTFSSQSFEVDGSPELKWNPRSRSVHHIECALVVVDG